jgi:hypothetical protein
MLLLCRHIAHLRKLHGHGWVTQLSLIVEILPQEVEWVTRHIVACRNTLLLYLGEFHRGNFRWRHSNLNFYLQRRGIKRYLFGIVDLIQMVWFRRLTEGGVWYLSHRRWRLRAFYYLKELARGRLDYCSSDITRFELPFALFLREYRVFSRFD